MQGFEHTICSVCQVEFYITNDYQKNVIDSQTNFFCPNGHLIIFSEYRELNLQNRKTKLLEHLSEVVKTIVRLELKILKQEESQNEVGY